MALEGIHALFNNRVIRKTLLALRIPLALVAAAAVIYKADPRWFWPGFAVSMAGELLQLWCFASLKKQKILAVRGPYALVRNPMYLARYLILLGALVMLGNVWIPVGFTFLYYFYMVNRVKREEAILAPIFGEDYERYCRSVNRFLPSLRTYEGNPVFTWSWELLIRNHGPVNLAGMLLFWGVAWWFRMPH